MIMATPKSIRSCAKTADSLLISGSRATGKTTVAHAVIPLWKRSNCIVITTSDEDRQEYLTNWPEADIYGAFQPHLIETLKMSMEAIKKGKSDKHIVLIDEWRTRYLSVVKDLIFSGKNLGVTLIVVQRDELVPDYFQRSFENQITLPIFMT